MNELQIEQALRDYNWMINEIKRQRELLSHVIGGNVVAHIDDMPKQKGKTGDPVAQEVIRRDETSKWVENLERKVLFIQKRIPIITDEREKVVLECLLDGLSMIAIGRHTGLSRTHVYRLKDEIIYKMLHFEQFGHFEQNMTSKSNCG